MDDIIGMLRRRIRLIELLDAADRAGLSPLPVQRLHTFAYLANVLAPVWDMGVFDGKLLKRRGGPFYPALQRDLDRLVGMGVVFISSLNHVENEAGRWRLEGAYALNRHLAGRILHQTTVNDDERRLASFLHELAHAASALRDEAFDRATTEDATYSDQMIDIGSVVDFAEWRDLNYTARAAQHFERLLPDRTRATRGEMLHMYVRHLQTRLYGGH